MEASTDADADADTAKPMFRSKKRKNIRQRSLDTSAPLPSNDDGAAQIGVATSNPHDDASVIQDALRLRKKRRSAFPSSSARDSESNALVVRDEDGQVQPKGIQDRFMHQTGFVADMDDRHMNAYIESRLRKSTTEGTQGVTELPTQDSIVASPQAQSQTQTQSRTTADQPTRQGKLLEVDTLPPLSEPKIKEPRRRRHRRGSDDIKRDQFIDAFLSENKLDVYDVSQQQQQSAASGSAADDRLAEEFQRQYMQEAYLRKQRRRPAINQPKGATAQQTTEDVLKGPKLGGSRNARSAVRDVLLSQQEKNKKR